MSGYRVNKANDARRLAELALNSDSVKSTEKARQPETPVVQTKRPPDIERQMTDNLRHVSTTYGGKESNKVEAKVFSSDDFGTNTPPENTSDLQTRTGQGSDLAVPMGEDPPPHEILQARQELAYASIEHGREAAKWLQGSIHMMDLGPQYLGPQYAGSSKGVSSPSVSRKSEAGESKVEWSSSPELTAKAPAPTPPGEVTQTFAPGDDVSPDEPTTV